MAEENHSPAAEPPLDALDAPADGPPATEGNEGPAPAGAADQGASGVLRDAIRHVLDEIEHHEREAKKHLQKARDLRKELRDSFAFVFEQGGREKLTAILAEGQAGPAAKPGSAVPVDEASAASRHPRSAAKKKRGAGKSKER
jgi:hypothetical protein